MEASVACSIEVDLGRVFSDRACSRSVWLSSERHARCYLRLPALHRLVRKTALTIFPVDFTSEHVIECRAHAPGKAYVHGTVKVTHDGRKTNTTSLEMRPQRARMATWDVRRTQLWIERCNDPELNYDGPLRYSRAMCECTEISAERSELTTNTTTTTTTTVTRRSR